MAKIELPQVKIQIEIPDLVIGGVALKRKATLHSFTYDQINKYLSLAWKVEFFETLEGDLYGDIITKQGINSYMKDVVANNSIMVDVNTGIEIYPEDRLVENEDGTSSMVMGYDETITYTGQYDWFNFYAETNSILVHEMIKVYGARTNWN